MPSLDATTTAIWASIGLSPSSIYATFVALIGQAVSFGLWMIQVTWPFLLGIAFILLMWGLASRYGRFGRHQG